MKAYILHAINDLRYEETPIPILPSNDWCLVKTKASGICSSDIARIFTKGTYHFPTIPGHEFSGEVYQVKDDKYSYLIGKKVGIFPLIPCHKCHQCANKHFEMCEHYNYLGSRCNGGFAEFVAVPIWNLVLLPDNMTFEHAAMLEPLSVALHAINVGNVSPGDNVAIIGTGMIGISAGQWAIKKGAESVTIIGRTEAKRRLVENCGLKYAINNDERNEKEFDFVLEAVGTPQSIQRSINMTKPGGTLLLTGNPSGDILFSQDDYWRILRKQLTIKGTWNSRYDGKKTSDWIESVNAISNGEINVASLISHRYAQEDLKEGLNMMNAHKEPYCKVMTIWNE